MLSCPPSPLLQFPTSALSEIGGLGVGVGGGSPDVEVGGPGNFLHGALQPLGEKHDEQHLSLAFLLLFQYGFSTCWE